MKYTMETLQLFSTDSSVDSDPFVWILFNCLFANLPGQKLFLRNQRYRFNTIASGGATSHRNQVAGILEQVLLANSYL